MMAESSSRPSLTVLGGPLAGTRLVLEDAFDDVLIGSDPACGFCLPVPGVSPVHARLWLENGGLTLFDAKSPHGVYLNDERVEDRVPVHNGDVIWLGSPGTDDAVMIQCRMPPMRTEAAAAAAAAASAAAVEVAKAEAGLSDDDDDDDDDAVTAEPLADAADPVHVEEGMGVDVVEEDAVVVAADEVVEAEVAEGVIVEAQAMEVDAVEAEAMSAEPEIEEAEGVEAEPAGVDDRTRPLPIYRGEGGPAEPDEAVPAGEFAIEESAEAAMAPTASEDEAFLMRDPEEFRVDGPTAMLRPGSAPGRTPAGFEDDMDEATATLLMPAGGRTASDPSAPSTPSAPPPRPAPPDAEATAFLAAAPAPPVAAAAPPPRPPSPQPAARPAAAPTPPPAPAVARSSPRTSPGVRPAAPARAPAAAASRPVPKGGGGKGAIIGIASAAALAVLGVGGFFAYKKFAAPAPTPAPTPVAMTVATTLPIPVSTILAAEAVPTPEPTPVRVEEAVTIVPSAPTPRPSAAASLPPKATPAPIRPTPAPVAATAAPDPAAQRAVQVASLLTQADSAAAAQNHDQAVSLFDEALKLDPANARATAGRQGAVAARDAGRRAFVAGRTVVRTDKAGGGGPAGFDSSGVSVQKAPDFQGRIEFAMSPARIKAGDNYSLKVFVVNEGKKPIKISGFAVITTVNGTKTGGPANPLAREIEPQQRALVDERSGTWADGVNAWATEVTVTAKSDSLRNQLTWK